MFCRLLWTTLLTKNVSFNAAYLDSSLSKIPLSVSPLISRQIRSSLTKKAEKESIEVFAKNLRQLLLAHPIKGKKILGIDPGFSNGCKIALIDEQNNVLETAVIYPHTKQSDSLKFGQRLAEMMKKHK